MKRVIIVGAAGRDFHNFNMVFRNSSDHEVVAFTAAQIPGIEGRTYPPELAGPRYPKGIPIFAERELPRLIKEMKADLAILSYSDLSYAELMHIGSSALAAGASGTSSGSRQRGHWTSVPIFFRPTFRRLRQLWQRKTTGICASGGRKPTRLRNPG